MKRRQRSRAVRPHRPVRPRHRDGLLGQPVAPPDEHGVARRVGPGRPRRSAPGSPGSCSAATSTPPTPSSRCRRRCARPARWPGSSRCPTRSSSTRSSSSSWRRLWSVSHRHGYVTHGRLRPRPVRSRGLVARRRGHRLPRDDALHRAPAGRHPGRARGRRPRRRRQRHRQGPAAVHRVRPARGLHLLGRPARPGDHRVRQGHPDLPRHHRRDHLPAHEVRRLDAHLRRRAEQDGEHQPGDGKPTGVFIPGAAQYWAYATLALGSAMALFMYPHSITASLSASQPQHDPAQRRHPAGLLASCSACSPCSAGSRSRPAPSRSALDGKPNAQLVIPQLFEDLFPSWFAGVAFAAIAIGALVPAAIMSIAAANTVHPQHLQGVAQARRDASQQEAKVSQARLAGRQGCSRWSSC